MSKFGDAFKAARASGKKTFKFGGKSYTTKTKEEGGGGSKKTPVPQSKPKQGTGSSAKSGSTGQAKTPKPKARPTDGPNARRRPNNSPAGGKGSGTGSGPPKRAKVSGASNAPAVGIARANSPIARKAAQIKAEKKRYKGARGNGGGGF